jgi:translation initiation factor 1
MTRSLNDDGLVYSTEFGKMCPRCNRPIKKCSCREKSPLPKSDGGKLVGVKCDGIVRLMRETKGRKGKGVTLIAGLPLEKEELKQMATSLKQKCGSGGSLKNGIIEIQGDHRDVLEKQLGRLGYKVKRSGG